jgi:hypothetical protein
MLYHLIVLLHVCLPDTHRHSHITSHAETHVPPGLYILHWPKRLASDGMWSRQAPDELNPKKRIMLATKSVKADTDKPWHADSKKLQEKGT